MVTGVRSEDSVVIITQLPAAQYQQANVDNFPILKGQEASILLLTLQPEVSASRTGIPARGNSTLWSGAQCSVRARRHYWHDRRRGFRQGN